MLEWATDPALELLDAARPRVVVNTSDRPLPLPGGGDLALESEPGAAAGRLAARPAAVRCCVSP